MRRPMPPLNAVRAFEAAARHQSFSRAAEELGVSHSAISRHVRGLEHRLECRLFRDLPRGVALTRDGERFFNAVSPALDLIAEGTEALRGRPAGAVVVNSEVLFATKWLVPRMGAFHAAYPEIEIRLEATDQLVNVARYEADLAIRFVKTGVPDGPAELLANLGIGAYAAPEIAAQIAAPGDILRFTLLRDRKPDLWEEWFAMAGVEGYVPTPWRTRAILSVEAAVHGQGVLLSSKDILLGHLARGDLVPLFETTLYSGAFFLIAGDGALRRKPVRVFRDWLLAETRGMVDPRGAGLNVQPNG